MVVASHSHDTLTNESRDLANKTPAVLCPIQSIPTRTRWRNARSFGFHILLTCFAESTAEQLLSTMSFLFLVLGQEWMDYVFVSRLTRRLKDQQRPIKDRQGIDIYRCICQYELGRHYAEDFSGRTSSSETRTSFLRSGTFRDWESDNSCCGRKALMPNARKNLYWL